MIEAAGGERCIVDPYESGGLGGRIGLSPLEVRGDFVVTTHDHEDHSAVGEIDGKPTRVDQGSAGPFDVRRWPAWHDEDGGRRFGGAVDVVTIEVGGCRILHLSDVGHAVPDDRPDAWIGADVCVLPVGGCYTIGPAQAMAWWERLRPAVTVPVHFGHPDIDLPLMPRASFLRRCPGAVQSTADGQSRWSPDDNKPEAWQVCPLEPLRG
jgi:L-ascorbate metabolism protein UlaG (beta-lactamase superfamily)